MLQFQVEMKNGIFIISIEYEIFYKYTNWCFSYMRTIITQVISSDKTFTHIFLFLTHKSPLLSQTNTYSITLVMHHDGECEIGSNQYPISFPHIIFNHNPSDHLIWTDNKPYCAEYDMLTSIIFYWCWVKINVHPHIHDKTIYNILKEWLCLKEWHFEWYCSFDELCYFLIIEISIL